MDYLLYLYFSMKVSVRIKNLFQESPGQDGQQHSYTVPKFKKRKTRKHSTVTRYYIAKIKTLNNIHNIYSQMSFIQSKRTSE